MIQSGQTNIYTVKYDFLSEEGTTKATISVGFPKPFNNTPVVQVTLLNSINEVELNSSPLTLTFKSYRFITDSVTKTGFRIEISIDYRFNSSGVEASMGNLLNFNWFAYDEVTIGA